MIVHIPRFVGAKTCGEFAPNRRGLTSMVDSADIQKCHNCSREMLGPLKEGAANMADIGTEVLFIAGFGPIDRNIAKSRELYGDSLGIPFKGDSGGYLYTGALQGAKHFALWPLSQAARSRFDTDSWPDNVPHPPTN